MPSSSGAGGDVRSEILKAVFTEVYWHVRFRYLSVTYDKVEDAMQDAVVAWLELERFPTELGQAHALLHTIARRMLRRRLKREAREVAMGDAEGSAALRTDVDFDRAVMVRELIERARKASITVRTRKILILTALGETLQDIAEALGLKYENAKKKLQRGLRRLQQGGFT